MLATGQISRRFCNDIDNTNYYYNIILFKTAEFGYFNYFIIEFV